MKQETKENVAVAANISQIISTVASIIGIIFPSLTVFILSQQEEPIKIESLSITLGSWYSFLLLLAAFCINIELLRNHWERKCKENHYNENFKNFLFSDLITRKQIRLIPTILIIGMFLYIIPGEVMFLLFFGLFFWLVIWVGSNDPETTRWNKRISHYLEKNGFVKTESFGDIGMSLQNAKEINSRLQAYYNHFEFDSNGNKQLSITPEEEIIHAEYGRVSVLKLTRIS